MTKSVVIVEFTILAYHVEIKKHISTTQLYSETVIVSFGFLSVIIFCPSFHLILPIDVVYLRMGRSLGILLLLRPK